MSALTVLIVDDHPHLVENLSVNVPWTELGIDRVLTAFSGPEALARIRSVQVDILLTDIRMPGMTGLELIEQARSVRPAISCILLTGFAEFEYARKAIELQTFRYLMKPVRIPELMDCLDALTADRRLKATPSSQVNPQAHGESAQPEQSENAEPDKPQSQPNPKVIYNVHEYIRLHIGGDVTLTAIADHVFLHPVYLSKLYKETTGTNLSEYILAARMDKAKELLRRSGLKIYEICEAVGYRSTQHFITEFKKAVGVTPKQYRDA